MSAEAYSTEMELYGVSPGIIAIIMLLISLIFPFGFMPDFGISIALIWVFVFPYFFLPLTLLNILYAIWIVKYYQGKSTKSSVVVLGLLSVILPTIIILYISGLFGSFSVLYPIPIQFIAGLILLLRIEGPEVISPWSGLRLDLSWWKWGRPKRKSDWDPFEEVKRAVEIED